MENKTIEQIYNEYGCSSKRDIIDAMEAYAQQEREIAVKKALEEVINQKKAYQKSGFIVETRDEDILSLYPKVIETLNKD